MDLEEWLNSPQSAGNCCSLPFSVENNRIIKTKNLKTIQKWKFFVVSLAIYAAFASTQGFILYRQLRSEEPGRQFSLALDMSLCLIWGH